jgi:hypothetical protein
MTKQRTHHTWKVMVCAESGAHTEEQTVKAFWDPDHVLTRHSVESAAVAQAWLKRDKRMKYVPASEPQLV